MVGNSHFFMGHEAELVDLPVEAQGIYRQVLHMHKDAKNKNTRGS
jgi:hypothetical protein